MTSSQRLLTLAVTAAFSILTTLPAFGAPETNSRIADLIKADVAQIVSGINAHDVDLAA